jgi:hypothetical protein
MNAPSGTHVTFPATLADVAPQLIWYPAREVRSEPTQGIIIVRRRLCSGNERIMAKVMRGFTGQGIGDADERDEGAGEEEGEGDH